MNNVPKKLRDKWAADPPKVCMRAGSECYGRLTKEHAIIYAGRQVQEDWAILDLCEYHHLYEGLDKKWNIEMAMSRATKEDEKRYPRLKWK